MEEMERMAKKGLGGNRPNEGARRDGSSGASRPILSVLGGIAILVAAIAFAWPSEQPAPAGARTAAVANADRIDVVYFHRTERCDSCQWAGAMSRKTVETYFQAELASGRVIFREVDVQQKENAALAYQYRASGSSLFLNYIKDGVDHIRQASDTYPYIGDEARFSERLRTAITAGLGSGG